MSTVKPTDLTMVNRAGVDYRTPVTMSTVQDTDLLLVNRGGVDYKCTFADWKAAYVPPASINKPSITSPADGATDLGEIPTFTSSAFSATGGITHSSSDWQVTLKADTGFASPVVQSMADTANLVSWNSGPLQPDTDYIVRVRHNGGGLNSPWSDAVGFKTKAAFVASIAPSDMALWDGTNTAPTKVALPAKAINAASNYGSFFAFCVDGHLYSVSAAGVVADEGVAPNGVLAGAIGYNGASVMINSAGHAEFYPGAGGYKPDLTATTVAAPATLNAVLTTSGKRACDTFLVFSDNNEVWCISIYDSTSATVGIGNRLLTVGAASTWVNITAKFNPWALCKETTAIKAIAWQPNGAAGTASSNYSSMGTPMILFNSGNLYYLTDIDGGSTVTPLLTNVKELHMGHDVPNFTVLMNDGTTRFIKGATSPTITNGPNSQVAPVFITDPSTSVLYFDTPGGNWRTPVFPSTLKGVTEISSALNNCYHGPLGNILIPIGA